MMYSLGFNISDGGRGPEKRYASGYPDLTPTTPNGDKFAGEVGVGLKDGTPCSRERKKFTKRLKDVFVGVLFAPYK